MARTNEETEFYIRTRHGATFYVESLEEALKEFASDEGYRLTLEEGSIQVVIRRSDTTTDENGIHEQLGERNYLGSVIIRDLNQK